MRKVFVLGLDGATFDLIGPWIDSGELPNLRRIADEGVRADLASLWPPLTPVAWPSFYMGKNPGKHGLYGYKVRQKGSYEELPVSAADRKGRTLFEHVGDQGGKVAVLSVPMTYPASPVNGVMVTCIFTPKLDDIWQTDCAYPPEFKEEMKRVIGTFKIHPDHQYRKGNIPDLLADYRETLKQRIDLCDHVIRTKEWDLAITVLNETDHIQHQVWHVHDPKHHDHDPEEFRKHGHVIKEFWKEVDRDVGRLAAALPPDATFMILSDHGHGPIYRWVHLNNMLAKKGLIRFKRGPLSLLKRAAFSLGFTPGNVYRLLLRLGVGGKKKGGGMEGGGGAGKLARRVFLSEDDIDWSRTRAYATGHMGQINVNLKGREPQGTVSKSEIPALRKEIEAALAEITDDGRPVIDRLVPREELFHGETLALASDFFVMTKDPSHQALGGASFISNRVVEKSYGNSATHRLNGIFLMKGPGVKRGVRIDPLRIQDLASHIMWRMGLKVPADFDGTISSGPYDDGLLDREPPQTLPLSEIKAGAGRERPLTDDEIAKMKENLKKLGYVD